MSYLRFQEDFEKLEDSINNLSRTIDKASKSSDNLQKVLIWWTAIMAITTAIHILFLIIG